MPTIFAEVIVNVPVKKLNKIFHYKVPPQLEKDLTLGSQVIVPFNNRFLEGVIVGFSPNDKLAEFKSIQRMIGKEPVFNLDILELAKWMSEKYFCNLITALNCVVPSFAQRGKAKTMYVVKLAKAPEEAKAYMEHIAAKAPKQAALIQLVLDNLVVGIEELAAAGETTRGTVQALVKKGLFTLEEIIINRDPTNKRNFAKSNPLKPTHEQQQALNALLTGVEEGKQKTFLIHGVTGSGKTEIYLQVIENYLTRGKQVIVLVPEISLTPQMVERFKGRFGSRVAVLHSRLSHGERFDEWQKIRKQEVDIVVGARSAVFAPFKNLGLIIIDEEHEASYKQEESPKYHAREVAIKRTQLVDGMVILGSATPSLESYYKAKQGEYQLISLNKRVEDRPLPEVMICDLREELKEGHKSIFSRLLIAKMQEKLLKGEQIILFLNRRGYSTFVMCRECGLVLKCPACSIPLTFHATDNSLHCHYCEFKKKTPQICPKCSSKYIKFFGIGTQKIEEEFKRLFPKLKVLRMDVDTTSRKGSHERILTAFQRGEAQVLIGTQMIAKGLDFPNVTLVGVITSDTSLNLPDFRASERTFQLLTQVAGRAGRHQKPGEVIIQTYNPEHYSIEAACRQNYLAFYDQEIEIRRQRAYPPFSSLIRILISHQEEARVVNMAAGFGAILQKEIKSKENIEVLGPAKAPIERIKGKYRWQLILKGKDSHLLLKVLSESYNQFEVHSVFPVTGVSVDVDPQALL